MTQEIRIARPESHPLLDGVEQVGLPAYARDLALEVLGCGQSALRVREAGLQILEKGEADFVTDVDLAIQDHLIATSVQQLNSMGYAGNILVIAEETRSQNPDLLVSSFNPTAEAVFTVDPIDGTTAYKDGSDQFVVATDMQLRDRAERYSFVYVPQREQLYVASKVGDELRTHVVTESGNSGFERNDYVPRRIATAAHYNKQSIAELQWLYSTIKGERVAVPSDYGENTSPGSLALDLIELAQGRYDIAINGGCYPWDVAAAQLFLEDSGLVLSDWQGSPVDLGTLQAHDQMLRIFAGHHDLVAYATRVYSKKPESVVTAKQ